MKNMIVYFTGTGNSLAIARLLATKLPESIIISVSEMLQQSLFTSETDTCGFVFPVYCQNAPEIVRRLTRLIKVPNDSYIYAIATHNGDPGYSHFTLDRILRKKDSAFGLDSPYSCPETVSHPMITRILKRKHSGAYMQLRLELMSLQTIF